MHLQLSQNTKYPFEFFLLYYMYGASFIILYYDQQMHKYLTN
jgi:hypothetical protein